MIPKELRAFIPDEDDGPPFYIVHKPGSELTAEQILLWVSERLDEVPNRPKFQWRVWFSEMAYGMVKERFWPWIDLIGYKEWLKIPSPNIGDWELRIKIARTEGDIEDLDSNGKIIDRVTINLEIDDGSEPGMP